MKFRILLFVSLLTSITVYSQSLGVGTTSPNSKAALHVESPTNNQGFIMPRLTTAQRTSIAPLSTGDEGLMVYDTQLNAIYMWSGTVWVASTQGVGGPRLQYPYVDTILSAPNNSNLLRMIYAGSGVENVGVGHFENLNSSNGFSSLFTRTNSATNGAIDAVVNNTTNNNDAIGVVTNGLGTAGRFSVNNTSNPSAAIYATTNGTGPFATSAAILGETSTAFSAITGVVTGPGGSNAIFGTSSSPNAFSYAVLGSTSGGGVSGSFNINNPANTSNALEASTNGTGGAAEFTVINPLNTKPALWVETNSNQPLSAAIYGLNTGTGDVAGSFRITNATNTFSSLYGETNGSGAAVFANQLGTGRSGLFQISNVSNTAEAFRATTNGTGTAGRFIINNASVVNSNAVYVTTNSSGLNSSAIRADHSGTAGYAGIIQNINASNPRAALFVDAVGIGPSLWANKDPGETGNAIDAKQSSSAGSAGYFTITDASNASAVIEVANAGAGFGVKSVSTGPEVAGYFQTINAASNATTLLGMTDASGGHAVGAINAGNGSAFSIFQGGMKVSTATLSGGGNITTRAVAYQISSGAAYTFNLTPALTDGEMFYMYNSSASPVTVAGANINANSGLLFIVLGGTPRPF